MSGFIVPSPNTQVGARAWEIHRINGHPKGYKGPCWGPLPDEVEQAKREIDDSAPPEPQDQP